MADIYNSHWVTHIYFALKELSFEIIIKPVCLYQKYVSDTSAMISVAGKI